MRPLPPPRLAPCDPAIDAAVSALIVLVLAIERTPGGPVAARYRAAIRRHGRELASVGGQDAMQTALRRIGDLSPVHADARRTVVAAAWFNCGPGIR